MTAAVIVLGLAVALLTLLVAGLLRSHAEILRALHELGVRVDGTGGPTSTQSTSQGSSQSSSQATHAPIRTIDGVPAPGIRQPQPLPSGAIADIAGSTLDGGATVIGIAGTGHQTLLAFLSSGCSTCRNHWDRFRDGDLGLPDSIRLVVVTKDTEHDSPAALASLAGDTTTLVMSSAAWDAYDVPVSPYFVLIDGPTNAVVGEGAAATWDQVRDLLLQAVGDRASHRTRAGAQGRRDQDADDALQAAGIEPGDPRMHHAPDQTTPDP